jgi:1,4-dihydroxy-2-naphthoate octaprenyltransferase
MHSMKKENPILQNSQNVLKAWFLATRPKTWIASLSPVCIGASMAETLSWPIFSLTLLFALLIQIGTNFFNDYADFIKGADSDDRQGPKRAVQQGWILASTMRKAAAIVFGLAFFSAIPLMVIAGIWSLPITIAAIAFGVFYTGGPKPLGYLGLGEILVFVFFGPIATCGTYYLQMNTLTSSVLLASITPGLLSCALLIANNLRDEKTDRLANKKTLVVRFGNLFGKLEYTVAIAIPTIIPLILVLFYEAPTNLLGVFFLFPIAIALIKQAFSFKEPKELISLLQGTSLLFFFYTLLFACSFL